jgi:hypothetical protein
VQHRLLKTFGPLIIKNPEIEKQALIIYRGDLLLLLELQSRKYEVENSIPHSQGDAYSICYELYQPYERGDITMWGKGENSLCRHFDKVTAKSRLISLPKGFGVKG